MNNLIRKINNRLKLKRRLIALLASLHFYGNPSKSLKIVGVTGTNGKTTVATLLYKVAIGLGHKAGLIGTVEVLINDEKYKFDHKTPTTPDPLTLNKILKDMCREKVEYVFMEVSSHAMDQNRVAGVHFVGGVFTNLTHDHLDYHKSLENYFKAKKKFFKILPKNAFALSNIDDEYGEKMLSGIRAQKYTYGFKNNLANPSAHEPDFKERLETGLIGEFNAYNTLAVFGATRLLGFDEHKTKELLKNITPPAGRFEYFMSPSSVLCIVDYAHTPDALENVLKTAKGLLTEGNKLISVFGCGGDRDPLKRKIMGKIGAIYSDIAIFTSDNPRNENPENIINQMKEGLSADLLEKVTTVPDRKQAILESIKIAQKGDIILCAGKGHETYQEIKGIKHHFNDMEEFQNILK